MSAQIPVSGPCLNLPVTTGAAKRHVELRFGGELVRYFDVELAEADGDFTVWFDVSEFAGGVLTVNDDAVAAAATFSDEPLGLEGVYHEALRPQFHFSARRGWLNDPNGLVHYDGQWHLFFQHNPCGWGWGNMHWGHAVSDDLLHWREQPEAIHPDALGSNWSGGAVIDWHNTSGLQAGGQPPICLFYTAAGAHAPTPVPFTQCLVASTDGGRTFAKYAGNPVVGPLEDSTRDPKVLWHEPSGPWVMALFLGYRGEDRVPWFGLFTSPDLRDWRQTQSFAFEGSGECPEFFELPVEGGDERWWVFIAADGRYQLGSFDGERFTPATGFGQLLCRQGKDNLYAAQTWSDAPDGRRVMIAWQQGNLPGMPFNCNLSVPVELTLRRLPEGIRLCAWPVAELAALVERQVAPGPTGELLDIEFEIPAGRVVLTANGHRFTIDGAARELRFADVTLPLTGAGGPVRILVDRGCVEVFVNRGSTWLGRRTAAGGATGVAVEGELPGLIIRELRGVWR